MAIIQTGLEPGKAHVEISSKGLKEVMLEFDVVAAEPEELVGVSVVDIAGFRSENRQPYEGEIPTRKVELIADRIHLDKDNPEAIIKAEIFPADSDYTNIEWICVFDDEDFDNDDDVQIAEIEDNGKWCRVTAIAPGSFRVCASCKGRGEMEQVISEIEMTIDTNIGQV